MKLKVYSTTNTANMASKPELSINDKGLIRFSTALVKSLSLEGKKVAFAEDEDHPGDWYLVLNNPHGFETRPSKSYKDGVTLALNNKAIAEYICKGLKMEVSGTVKIPMATKESANGVYAILTKGAYEVRQKAKKKGGVTA